MKRNMLRLGASSVFNQVLNLMAIPVLVKYYSAEIFGLQALFQSFAMAVSGVGTLRFELALITEKEDKNIGIIFYLNLMIAVVLALLVAFGIYLLTLYNPSLIPKVIEDNLPLLIVFIISESMYEVMKQSMTRKKDFKSQANLDNLKLLFAITVYIVGVWLDQKTAALLILGLVSSSLVCLLIGLYKIYDKAIFKVTTLNEAQEVFKGHSHFVRYGSLGSVINNVTLNMPNILINNYFGAQATGYFSMAMKIIRIPMGVLTQAISRVYFGEIRGLNLEDIKRITKKVMNMMVIALAPLLVLDLIGKEMFSLIMGPEWEMASHYSGIMVFFIFFWGLTNPITNIFHNFKAEKELMYYQILKALVRVLPFILLSKVMDVLLVVKYFTIAVGVSQLLQIIAGFKIIKMSAHEMIQVFRPSLVPLAIYIALNFTYLFSNISIENRAVLFAAVLVLSSYRMYRVYNEK